MRGEWSPTEYDVQWTRNLFNVLNVGGLWGTSYAIYRKKSEKRVALIKINQGIPSDILLENLDRTKKAIIAAGFEYVEETDI